MKFTALVTVAAYQEMQARTWALLRQAQEDAGRRLSVREQSQHDYQRVIPELENILGGYLQQNRSLTPYVAANPNSLELGR